MFDRTSIVVETGDGRNVTIVSPFRFNSADGTVYTVPAGATSDGASTPRAIWSLYPPFGPYWLAAVFHDWLYRLSGLPREKCDALLLEAMQSLGVDPFTASTIYHAVRVAGESSFAADRAQLSTEH